MKHAEEGKDSPLSCLNWDNMGPKIKEAVQLDENITSMKTEMDQMIERRRKLVEDPDGIADFVRQSRDVLSGIHRNEMRKLCDFGFEVSDSAKSKKSAVKAANGQQ